MKLIQTFTSLFFERKSKYDVYEIFTPSTPATYTFVDREDVNIELINAINTPGKQIIVYGFSGSGKTTLLHKKIAQKYAKIITSRCTDSTTFQNLLLDVFDQLNTYYLDTIQHKKSNKVSGGLEGEVFYGIKPKLSTDVSEEKTSGYIRSVPFQINERKLAEYLKKYNCCWIIEDFHKVNLEEKISLANSLKLFMDIKTKVVAIGAVGTARQVVEINKEMYNRVAEIAVPLMNETQLRGIIKLGEKYMNIEIDDNIKSSIVKFSNGLASVCHQLCLNLCLEKNIEYPQKIKHKLGENEFNLAVSKYLKHNSDNLKSTHDKAIRVEDNDNNKYPTTILISMLRLHEKDEITLSEIYEEFNELNEEKELDKSTFKNYLEEFLIEKRGKILRYNENSNKYFFADSFFVAYCFCLHRTFLEKKFTNISNKSFIYLSCVNSKAIDEISPKKAPNILKIKTELLEKVKSPSDVLYVGVDNYSRQYKNVYLKDGSLITVRASFIEIIYAWEWNLPIVQLSRNVAVYAGNITEIDSYAQIVSMKNNTNFDYSPRFMKKIIEELSISHPGLDIISKLCP